MAKGKHSGNLENGTAAKDGIVRQRKDYTVHVLEADGTRHAFECGTSLTAAARVTEAVKLFGGKRLAKIATVAKDHVNAIQGHKLADESEIENW